MSRNRSRKQPPGKQQKLRGPSRPVDPRYAPGRPVRRGPDGFAMGLIGVSTALVLVIAILILLNNNQQPVAGVPNQPVVTVSGGQAGVPNATQTAIAFTNDTANLARITAPEARALVEANNATIIDVRPKEGYAVQHVKGATNIPYTDTQARISEYPKTGNLIVYCQ
ncbi:MAG TPA: rhodanese-like domain-containing protein [Chloroflexia bacterium]|nr:rhodanese-like domain-containing protein [Chloroflexia bacterium]